jgi:probable lipoprotein LpqN
MIQIARTLRVFAGGLAAGAIGVTVFAGATAAADPLLPAPPAPAPTPAPAPAPAPAQQNVTTLPGQVPNRSLSTPPTTNPFAPPVLATAPGAPGTVAAAPVAPMPPTLTPAVSGTIREYLQLKGVKLEAQKPQGLKALDITLPLPPRWTQVPDPNVPDAFAVIADRQGSSIYTSNAQVVVYKLVGNFDPQEAVSHGYVDSQKLLAWQTTNASMADFDGFPSAIIEGTYRDGDMTLNTSRRHVIARSGREAYLVSLAVTTDRSVAVGDAPATDAIVNGFRVSAPGAAVPAPAQAPATAPVAAAGLPGQPPAPNRLAAPAAPQATPNLLTMVPGLPPLPNFSFLQH